MKTRAYFTIYSILIFGMIATAIPSASPKSADPVELRVARVSAVGGSVTMMRTTDEDWVEAKLNTPLLVQDKLYAGEDAKGELQLEDEIFVRLAADTFVQILSLDDALGRFEVQKGTVNVRANDVNYARPPFEIVGKYFRALITTHTDARFDVSENGAAEIQVRHGEVKVEKDENTYFIVQPGERIVIPSPNPSTYAIMEPKAEDDFDRWCELRDAQIASSNLDNPVTTRIAGTSDLDRYGEWVNTSDYGRVWRPTTVTREWRPYYDGEWVWREPYGWAWVSYEPWGWAPYHYGRWVHTKRYRWVWSPREVVHVVYRPRWRPALVSFVYADHGRFLNFRVGGSYYSRPCVGWFPLGLHDPYVPWYPVQYTYADPYSHRFYHWHGHGYGHGGNHITNIIHNENHYYENKYIDNAITAMPVRDFHAGNYRTKTPITMDRSYSPLVKVGHEALPKLSNRRKIVTKQKRDHIEIAYSETEESSTTLKTSRTVSSQSKQSVSPTNRMQTMARRGNPSASTSANQSMGMSPTRNQAQTQTARTNTPGSIHTSNARRDAKTGKPIDLSPSRSRGNVTVKTNPRTADKLVTYPRNRNTSSARDAEVNTSRARGSQSPSTVSTSRQRDWSTNTNQFVPRTAEERRRVIESARQRSSNFTNSRNTSTQRSRTSVQSSRNSSVESTNSRSRSNYKPKPGVYSTQPRYELRNSPVRHYSNKNSNSRHSTSTFYSNDRSSTTSSSRGSSTYSSPSRSSSRSSSRGTIDISPSRSSSSSSSNEKRSSSFSSSSSSTRRSPSFSTRSSRSSSSSSRRSSSLSSPSRSSSRSSSFSSPSRSSSSPSQSRSSISTSPSRSSSRSASRSTSSSRSSSRTSSPRRR